MTEIIFKDHVKKLNREDKKTIYDFVVELDNEIQLCPRSKRERISELRYKDPDNLVLLSGYPLNYYNELIKGVESSGESLKAFYVRIQFISKLEEWGIYKIVSNDKVFLKYGDSDNYWVLRINHSVFEQLKKIVLNKNVIEFELILKEGKITINNIPHKYKPHPDGDNIRFLTYLYGHANRTFTKTELKQKGISFGKNFSGFVNNLKITGKHRKAFFPGLTASSIHFRNPVYKNDLQ